MKNITSIILLTDFSDPAKNAIKYAVNAFGRDVEYHLVNTYYARTSSGTLINVNDMLASESKAGLKKEIEWIEKEHSGLSLKVTPHAIYGSPDDVIKKLVDRDEMSFDLVIMGTKGASGVEAVLFGSVASSVIRSSVIPVISVPPNYTFKGMENIVFASDGQEISDLDILTPIHLLKSAFNSQVTIFSVNQEEECPIEPRPELGIEGVKYTTVVDDDIVDAVSRFCQHHNSDLLVVYPKHKGFFERLFHKSISKKLVEQASMPILALENK